jgi:hypothetical protein
VAPDWTPISDGQIDTGSIGAIEVSDSHPNVVYVGTGSAAIRSNVIIGRGATSPPMRAAPGSSSGLKDAGQIGSHRRPPDQPRHRWLAALGSPFGPNERARRLQDDRRRQDLDENAVRQRAHRRSRRRDELVQPERAVRRDVPRLPQGLGHHQRRAGD